ncbi:hypothetical protein WJX73_001428 [Symbiochloris irregularis]|uniref:beta-ketoacyl-[acyl-carrier-protein] synthase I n=1 Tax=Symbiochloris irregularis TaxID=706552 RepID=A0AAW1PBK2_9CHLO
MSDFFGALPVRSQRQVVVTGLGIVCALGSGLEHVWQRLTGGSCGIATLQEESLPEDQRAGFDVDQNFQAGMIPATVLRQALEDLPHLQKTRQTSPCVAFAEIAAAQALQGARWAPTEDRDRDASGVVMGSGLAFTAELATAGMLQAQGTMRRLSPHFVPRVLGNTAAGHVSMRHGLRGPNLAPACAGAAGAQALCDAFRLVRDGTADVMVAGGSDSCLDVVSFEAYSRAVSLHNKTASSAASSQQQVEWPLGQGASVLVLEELEHARTRRAHIYAQILGCSSLGPSMAVAAPSSWAPADQAEAAALEDAGLSQKDIALYFSSHPTRYVEDLWSQQDHSLAKHSINNSCNGVHSWCCRSIGSLACNPSSAGPQSANGKPC